MLALSIAIAAARLILAMAGNQDVDGSLACYTIPATGGAACIVEVEHDSFVRIDVDRTGQARQVPIASVWWD